MTGYLKKTVAPFTLEGAMFVQGRLYNVPAGHENKFEDHSKPEKKTKKRKDKEEAPVDSTEPKGAKLEVVE